MRKFMTAVTAAALVAPAFVSITPAQAKTVYKEWTSKDGKRYCRRSDGTIGVIAGGVAGALLGRTIDTSGDRTLGTLGGAAAGALLGREVDKRVSRRQCK